MTKSAPNPVVRNSEGLRDCLFDELDQLRNGKTNPAQANATARLADQICQTVKMEMEVQLHVAKLGKTPDVGSLLNTPLALGSR